MTKRFALVKGANTWRVIELVHSGTVDEYRYATDPLKTKTEATAALTRFFKTATTTVENPLEEEKPKGSFL